MTETFKKDIATANTTFTGVPCPSSDRICFMDDFKYFKQRRVSPDLGEVLDLQSHSESKDEELKTLGVKRHTIDVSVGNCEGFKPIDSWNAFEVTANPGLFVIPNPFESLYHRYWAKRCLLDYPKHPNVRNIDAVANKSVQNPDDLWEAAWKEAGHGEDMESDYSKSKKAKRQAHNSLERSILWKLRWVTTGYHYDWTNKTYDPEQYTEIPGDLSTLCDYLARAVNGSSSYYSAEAAIVNYYHLDSTLSAHTDHSELDLTAPLISISFGNPCVFLIGGTDRQMRPTALRLNSGDVAIMTGVSRRSYHAVPRVIHDPTLHLTTSIQSQECPVDVTGEELSEPAADWQTKGRSSSTLDNEECVGCDARATEPSVVSSRIPYCSVTMKAIAEDFTLCRRIERYVEGSRININVRQMFAKGTSFANYGFK